MKLLRFALAVVLAYGAHMLLVRLFPSTGSVINFPTIVLVLFARKSSVLGAALFGGSLGWANDALAGSLYGLHGIAGTLAGAVCARAAQQVSFRQPALLTTMFAVAVVFQEVVVASLMRLLFPDPPAPDPMWALLSAVSTALVGGVFVLGLRRVETRWRRYRRVRRPKIRFQGRRA